MPMFTILDEYDQAGEDVFAATLIGKRTGYAFIFNTTRQATRIWNGTVFETSFFAGQSQNGTLIFTSQKMKSAVFATPFTSPPNILFSNNANTSNVNYKTNVSINGFTMNFQTNFTGTVDWVAIEKSSK